MLRKVKRSLPAVAVVLLAAVLLCAMSLLSRAEAEVTPRENPAPVTFSAVDGVETNGDEGYAKLLDGLKSAGTKNKDFSKWCVSMGDDGVYVVIKASSSIKVTGYTLVTGNDTAGNAGRNPKSWTLSASNDYDETTKSGTWTTLASVTDDSSLPAENFAECSFTVSEPVDGYASYQYYKFHCTEVQGTGTGGSLMQLCEISLTYTLPGFYVTALDGTEGVDASEGYANLFDGKKTQDNFSKWCVTPNAEEPVYMVFRTSEPIVLNGYAFVTGNDNASSTGRNPKSWTLYGSYDYDETSRTGTWSPLHTVTDDTLLTDVNYDSVVYALSDNHALYQYYKLEISENKGGNLIQLSEMELSFDDCTHNWTEGTPSAATCTEPPYRNYTCSLCEATKREVNGVPSGHDWQETSREAETCTENEKIHEGCSRCSATRTTEGNAALGHDWRETGSMDATCTAWAYVDVVCERCHETEHRSVAPAKGHLLGADGICLRCAAQLGATTTVGDFTVTGGTEGTDYTYANGILTILTDTPLTIANTDPETATTDRIYIAVDVSARITLAGVNINLGVAEASSYYNFSLRLCAFEIAKDSKGDVTITLADGTTNFLMSGAYRAAIQKMGANGSLLINGQGRLEVWGGPYAPGIGTGGYYDWNNAYTLDEMVVANITIADCTVVAGGSRINVQNDDGSYKDACVYHSGGGYTVVPSAAIGIGYLWNNCAGIIVPGHIQLLNANVTAYTVGSSGIGAAFDGQLTDVTIVGGSYKWIQNISHTYAVSAVGGRRDACNDPVNAAGERLYLLEIDNSDGDRILIDGAYAGLIAHAENDKKVYAWLTGEAHTVQVGNKVYRYSFNEANIATYNSVFVLTEGDPTTVADAVPVFTVTSASDSLTVTPGVDYTYASGVLTILSGTPMIISSNGLPTTDVIVIASTDPVHLTLRDIHIDVSLADGACALSISAACGDVTLVIESDVTLKSGKERAGLEKASSGRLSLTGTGALYVYGGENGAGIGGGNGNSGCKIDIAGASIVAVGGTYAAGVGGGNGGVGEDIKVTGGVLTANGGRAAAGIGGGKGAHCADVTISGGTVLAIGSTSDCTAQESCDGVGGGAEPDTTSDNIAITGGSVRIASYQYGKLTNHIQIGAYTLHVLPNPSGATVTIGGSAYALANSAALDDTNLYLWYTEGDTKTIVVGEESHVWHCDAGEIVECKAGTDWSVNDESHWHVCGAYGCDTKFDLAEHAFTEQTVSDAYFCTAATCTEPATYYYSCICGKKGTTTFTYGDALGHTHTGIYRELTGEGKHEEYCSVCETYVTPTVHTFDQVVREARYVRREASCTETASYYKSCVCGAHTTETWQDDPDTTLGHEVNTALGLQKDASGHWYACTRCDEKLLSDGTTGYEAHSWHSDCSTTCSICSYDRSAAMAANHDPAEAWSYNEASHWHACKRETDAHGSTCTAQLDLAAHTYENGRYKTIDGRHYPQCDTCDYYDATRGETCDDSTWEHDDTEHWHACSVCGTAARDTTTAHTFDNACDTTCNDGCGYTRVTEHHYDEEHWVSDETAHWHECTICHDRKDRAEHLFNIIDYNEEEHWEACLCGKTRNAEPHTYADDTDTTCEGCSYIRKLRVTSIRLHLSGYAIDERITALTVTPDEDHTGVYWNPGSKYYNEMQNWWYWWIVTDLDEWGYYNDYVDYDDPGCFLPMTDYWLVVELYPDDDYTFEYLTYSDVVLEGVGSACYIDYSTLDEDYMQVYFRLPILTGESHAREMPELDFTLSGYEVGEVLTDVTLIQGANDLTLSGMELTFWENGNYIDRYDVSTIIKQGSYYDLDVTIYAPDGYTFRGFTADMIHIEGLGTPKYLEVSAGGGSVYFWYRLPSTDLTHVHDRGNWNYDYTLDTHYRYCLTCHEILDETLHVYDGPYDDCCNVCGYRRELTASELTFILDGYETDGKVSDLKLSLADTVYGYDASTMQVIFAESYDGSLGDAILLDEDDCLLPGREYWVAVMIALDSDFSLKDDFTAADASIVGGGSAFMLMPAGSQGVIAYFRLQTLTGESAYDKGFPHANYTVNNYTAGQAYADLEFTPSADVAGIQSISFTLIEDEIDVSYASGALDQTKNYMIAVTITIERGYTLLDLPSDALTLTGAAELLQYWTDLEVRQAMFLFRMPTLDTAHVHAYTTEVHDDTTHWMQCACGERSDVQTHDFGSETGLSCASCGYVRSLPVTDVVLTLGGYAYGSTVDGLTIVAAEACGATVEAGYYNGFVLGTDLYSLLAQSSSGMIPPDEAPYVVFGNAKDYYLMVRILAMPNYTLDTLSLSRIQLSDVGAPLIMASGDATSMIVIFRLPRLVTPHTHDGLAWIDEIPATCLSDGTRGHFHCDLCKKDYDSEGNELSELIIASSADAHDRGAWIDTIPATCTETGTVGHYHCAACGADLDADGNLLTDLVLPIDADAHTRGAWNDEIPATTEAAGTRGHSDCLACGKHFGADGKELTALTIDRLTAYVVRVTGGTVNGGASATVMGGERVTVVADAPADGMVFLGWYNGEGELVSRDAAYSFPASSDLTLRAVCEEEQKSLPSGAVAGITVGSVLVAEVAAFSLFWFVIRKKSLGALLGLFRKP